VDVALSGNLCRCTGYVPIVDAVLAVAAELREEVAGT
jgi:xanthine dehydrogenase iron-sulfur cluster and FAD-binding subunit A